MRTITYEKKIRKILLRKTIIIEEGIKNLLEGKFAAETEE
jgi:hypothetical protein